MRRGPLEAEYLTRKVEGANMALPVTKSFADPNGALHQFVHKARFFSFPENLAAGGEAERRRHKLGKPCEKRTRRTLWSQMRHRCGDRTSDAVYRLGSFERRGHRSAHFQHADLQGSCTA